MRHYKMGAIALVAATCLGSGIFALPMVFAPLGILPSLSIMIVTVWVMYYSALVNVELILQVGEALPLGSLSYRLSGRKAAILGWALIKLLSYAVLTVYLSGLASVVTELQGWLFAGVAPVQGKVLLFTLTLLLVGLLSLPIRWIDYVNRGLFLALFVLGSPLLVGLFLHLNWGELPWLGPHWTSLGAWAKVLPVVFTAFGFQVIFHTVTYYCQYRVGPLKKVFFWGSLCPAILYCIWSFSALGVLFYKNPLFYQNLVNGQVSVGALMLALAELTDYSALKVMISCVTLSLLVSSLLCVSLGLRDAIEIFIQKGNCVSRLVSVLVVYLPVLLLSLWIPNAFIVLLGVAGCILVVIAIMLPLYLLYCISPKKWHYPELSSPMGVMLMLFIGLVVVLCEGGNIW
jgi:tyrosine-specific transport protein